MRSLVTKVVLAFVAVCLVEALIVAFLVRDSTRQSFDRFVEVEALRIFTEDVSSYYDAYGTLEGLHEFLPARAGRRPPPGPGPNRRPPPGRRGGTQGPRYGFADATGVVFVSNGDHQPGQVLTEGEMDAAKSVSINAELSGFILYPHEEPTINPGAREYLESTDRALLIALAGGVSVALILGVLFARSYMGPLRELTAATQEITQGGAHKPVQVRTRDEIGVLTGSFNQMAAELDRAKQSRRRMTADIAHELRSPLGILTGYLEAFQTGDLQANPERLKTMFTEAKHLERLIDDLRMLALADAGELPLSFQPVQPNELLENTKASFAQAASEAGVELKVKGADGLPELSLDPDRMKQVLDNLVGNALRYTPAGGKITLSSHKQEKKTEIRVQDTGVGIASELLPYIFNRFYKADTSRSDRLETSGLGLAIAKSFVEAHKGEITVTSEEGRGTTFSILLPV